MLCTFVPTLYTVAQSVMHIICPISFDTWFSLPFFRICDGGASREWKRREQGSCVLRDAGEVALIILYLHFFIYDAKFGFVMLSVDHL